MARIDKQRTPSSRFGAAAQAGDGSSRGNPREQADAAAVIRFVDSILQRAVEEGASDVHFEPFEGEFRIRYRIDGALLELEPPPHQLCDPVISRIKVLSDMNLAEHRVPQDGRIRLDIAGRSVDLRVNTLPTRFGESVVVRVLDRFRARLDLDCLGLPADIRSAIREILKAPNGMFTVTGPTGSGKTTTLYSAIGELNSVSRKILTAEDPVEYEIEGLIQVPVNHHAGLDFSRILRALLRQDPDTIMVGEIRDPETARIAMRAALTGHLVLTTLHTSDSVSAVTRLINLGLESHLIAAALQAVLAQRLLRSVCPECSAPRPPDTRHLERLGISEDDIEGRHWHAGDGCPACRNTGYCGRFGIFELLRLRGRIGRRVAENSPPAALRREAVRGGMVTLREAGIRAVREGRTTAEEVLRNTE